MGLAAICTWISTVGLLPLLLLIYEYSTIQSKHAELLFLLGQRKDLLLTREKLFCLTVESVVVESGGQY